jgi:hypothetical protein
MKRMTVALIIVLVLGSGAVGFIFGSQFNSESLVLNITNKSNDTGFDTGFYDDSNKKYKNITKIKRNTTSNSTSKKNSTPDINDTIEE